MRMMSKLPALGMMALLAALHRQPTRVGVVLLPGVQAHGARVRTQTPRHLLFAIEEADAWFEYCDSTKGMSAGRYAEIEPWAWARLQQRLRAIRARRARLEPLIEAA